MKKLTLSLTLFFWIICLSFKFTPLGLSGWKVYLCGLSLPILFWGIHYLWIRIFLNANTLVFPQENIRQGIIYAAYVTDFTHRDGIILRLIPVKKKSGRYEQYLLSFLCEGSYFIHTFNEEAILGMMRTVRGVPFFVKLDDDRLVLASESNDQTCPPT